MGYVAVGKIDPLLSWSVAVKHQVFSASVGLFE